MDTPSVGRAAAKHKPITRVVARAVVSLILLNMTGLMTPADVQWLRAKLLDLLKQATAGLIYEPEAVDVGKLEEWISKYVTAHPRLV